MNKPLQTKAAAEILDLFASNNPEGWNMLYDIYAPMMYGAIVQITGNDKIAEKILLQVFVSLKQNPHMLRAEKPLYISLLHHTTAIAKDYLSLHKPDVKPKPVTVFPLTHSLLYNAATLRSVAEDNAISQAAIKSKLHEEIKAIRNTCTPKFNMFAV